MLMSADNSFMEAHNNWSEMRSTCGNTSAFDKHDDPSAVPAAPSPKRAVIPSQKVPNHRAKSIYYMGTQLFTAPLPATPHSKPNTLNENPEKSAIIAQRRQATRQDTSWMPITVTHADGQFVIRSKKHQEQVLLDFPTAGRPTVTTHRRRKISTSDQLNTMQSSSAAMAGNESPVIIFSVKKTRQFQHNPYTVRNVSSPIGQVTKEKRKSVFARCLPRLTDCRTKQTKNRSLLATAMAVAERSPPTALKGCPLIQQQTCQPRQTVETAGRWTIPRRKKAILITTEEPPANRLMKFATAMKSDEAIRASLPAVCQPMHLRKPVLADIMLHPTEQVPHIVNPIYLWGGGLRATGPTITCRPFRLAMKATQTYFSPDWVHEDVQPLYSCQSESVQEHRLPEHNEHMMQIVEAGLATTTYCAALRKLNYPLLPQNARELSQVVERTSKWKDSEQFSDRWDIRVPTPLQLLLIQHRSMFPTKIARSPLYNQRWSYALKAQHLPGIGVIAHPRKTDGAAMLIEPPEDYGTTVQRHQVLTHGIAFQSSCSNHMHFFPASREIAVEQRRLVTRIMETLVCHSMEGGTMHPLPGSTLGVAGLVVHELTVVPNILFKPTTRTSSTLVSGASSTQLELFTPIDDSICPTPLPTFPPLHMLVEWKSNLGLVKPATVDGDYSISSSASIAQLSLSEPMISSVIETAMEKDSLSDSPNGMVVQEGCVFLSTTPPAMADIYIEADSNSNESSSATNEVSPAVIALPHGGCYEDSTAPSSSIALSAMSDVVYIMSESKGSIEDESTLSCTSTSMHTPPLETLSEFVMLRPNEKFYIDQPPMDNFQRSFSALPFAYSISLQEQTLSSSSLLSPSYNTIIMEVTSSPCGQCEWLNSSVLCNQLRHDLEDTGSHPTEQALLKPLTIQQMYSLHTDATHQMKRLFSSTSKLVKPGEAELMWPTSSGDRF